MAERYRYSISNPKETGFTLVTCVDTKTGIIVRTPLASPDLSWTAFMAFIGARYSRFKGGMEILMKDNFASFQEQGTDPQDKLGKIVDGLKHQSPAGMAHVMTAIEQVPIELPGKIFESLDLGDGQEGSTRFLEYGEGNNLPELANLLPEGSEISADVLADYQDLQKFSLDKYKEWQAPVRDFFNNHFNIEENSKKERDALDARMFDTVRIFLLSGFKTSMVLVANATTVQQLIANLGSNRLPSEGQLAEALAALLAPKEKIEGYNPEIKALLNHIEPNMRTRDEQIKLKSYFDEQPGFRELLQKRRTFKGLVDNTVELLPKNINAADQLIAQQILVIHPSLRLSDIYKYVTELSDKQRGEIGAIVFSNRDRFYLPDAASSGGAIGVDYNLTYAEKRDVARHRAHRRVSLVDETHVGLGEIPDTGFIQADYLRQIPEMEVIQKGIERDMMELYEKRNKFLEKITNYFGKENAEKVGMYLLPLGHQVEMVMSSDMKFMVHLLDMRIRPGVQINVRGLMSSLSEQLADRDALYGSLRYPLGTVLVDNREQFLDRS